MSQRYDCCAISTPCGTPLTLEVSTRTMFHSKGTKPTPKRESVPAAPNWNPMSLSPPTMGNPAGS